MTAVTPKEQQNVSRETISQQAQEKVSQQINLGDPSNIAATSSQIAQILAMLESLDPSEGEAHAKAIIDFPLEGSNSVSSGFASLLESESKQSQEKLGPFLKALGEAVASNPSPEVAKFLENGKVSFSKFAEYGTQLLQNAAQEFERLTEEVKKEESKKEGAEELAEKAKAAKNEQEESKEVSDAAPAQSSPETEETENEYGFGFNPSDSYVFMTKVLAIMSDKVNAIEAKVAENSSKTADWNYTLSQAFIAKAQDALDKAIEQKKEYDKMMAKKKRMDSWMKPLMIVVMVVSTALLVLAGQPYLAVMMLALMVMQMTGGTEKLLGQLTLGLEKAGMGHKDAAFTADMIYVAAVVAMACCGNWAGGAMAVGTSGLVMTATTAMATSSLFNDIAELILRDWGGDEKTVKLACMISGIVFCFVANIGAYCAMRSMAGGAELMGAGDSGLLGNMTGAVIVGGAVLDVGVAIATSVLQIVTASVQMDIADAEKDMEKSGARMTYYDNLSMQMTMLTEQIVDSNNATIRALGEGLSTALNTYASAGDNLARHMA